MKNNTITVFGEVLFDHFPDGSQVIGGAPFNVAWHLQAFGQKPRFISRVGNDLSGKLIQQTMQSWQMDSDFLQVDTLYPTGRVQVSFEQNEPSYAILTNQAYDYIQEDHLDNIDRTGILYHGTLATRSPISNQTLALLKSAHQGILFIDVNLRQPWWSKDNVLSLMKEADWVKLNLTELHILHETNGDIKTSMEQLLNHYNLQGIIVTCAEAGALALNNQGEFISVLPMPVDIKDTVGAGDAFSAVMLLGLALGWDLGQSMENAQIFASAMVAQQGATVNDLNFYKPFLSLWKLQ